jgi:hypothetical protein
MRISRGASNKGHKKEIITTGFEPAIVFLGKATRLLNSVTTDVDIKINECGM